MGLKPNNTCLPSKITQLIWDFQTLCSVPLKVTPWITLWAIMSVVADHAITKIFDEKKSSDDTVVTWRQAIKKMPIAVLQNPLGTHINCTPGAKLAYDLAHSFSRWTVETHLSNFMPYRLPPYEANPFPVSGCFQDLRTLAGNIAENQEERLENDLNNLPPEIHAELVSLLNNKERTQRDFFELMVNLDRLQGELEFYFAQKDKNSLACVQRRGSHQPFRISSDGSDVSVNYQSDSCSSAVQSAKIGYRLLDEDEFLGESSINQLLNFWDRYGGFSSPEILRKVFGDLVDEAEYRTRYEALKELDEWNVERNGYIPTYSEYYFLLTQLLWLLLALIFPRFFRSKRKDTAGGKQIIAGGIKKYVYDDMPYKEFLISYTLSYIWMAGLSGLIPFSSEEIVGMVYDFIAGEIE